MKKTFILASATALTASLTLVSPAVATSPEKTMGRLHTNLTGGARTDMAYAVADQAERQSLNAARTAAYEKAAKKAHANRASRAAKRKPPRWVTAINAASTKLGHRYVWGGESDAEGGYDCSGLVMWAYSKAGVRLPRVANDQYRASSRHPRRSQLRPGDLVFYGKSERGIHHVGLYVGKGTMLHAPRPGTVIRFNKVSYMSDYYGATRVG